MRFSLLPDEDLMAWVEGAGTLHAFDLGSMRELPLRGPQLRQNILCLAFLPGGRLVFINKEGSPEVWDLRGGRRLGTSSGPGPFAHGHLSASRDGSLLAGLTVDSTLALWDLVSQRRIVLLPNERAGIWCFAWSPDGTKVAVGLNDGGVFLWDLPEVRRELGRLGLEWEQGER